MVLGPSSKVLVHMDPQDKLMYKSNFAREGVLYYWSFSYKLKLLGCGNF